MTPTTTPRKALALGTLLFSLAISSVSAAVPSSDESRPAARTENASIEQGVQRVLDSRLRTNVFDWVKAEVEGTRVTLHGAVNSPANLNRIEKQIRRIPGVTEVAREVDVLPVSGFDDRLRLQAFRLIYGNLTFSQYPALGRTPIHIIVDSGRITLVGNVSSKVEARLAEARVRASTLAFKVSNEIQVGSAKAAKAITASTLI